MAPLALLLPLEVLEIKIEDITVVDFEELINDNFLWYKSILRAAFFQSNYAIEHEDIESRSYQYLTQFYEHTDFTEIDNLYLQQTKCKILKKHYHFFKKMAITIL